MQGHNFNRLSASTANCFPRLPGSDPFSILITWEMRTPWDIFQRAATSVPANTAVFLLKELWIRFKGRRSHNAQPLLIFSESCGVAL